MLAWCGCSSASGMRVLCVCVHFHKIMIVFGSFASQTYLCMYSFDLAGTRGTTCHTSIPKVCCERSLFKPLASTPRSKGCRWP